jgi:hypothetical protein
LCATGRPCSTPRAPPFAVSSSARAASVIARSATSVTMAFTAGLMRSIRARCAVITSARRDVFATYSCRQFDGAEIAELIASACGSSLRVGCARQPVQRAGNRRDAEPLAERPAIDVIGHE